MEAEQWDARYGQGRVWSVEPNRFFAEIIEGLPVGEKPGRAIDLACGEGRNSVWLAQSGWEVTGVDFSSVGIETGREGAASVGVEVDWVVADLRSHELGEGVWDLVAHVYLHWGSDIRLPFFERCAAAVAPGGYLVIVGHDRDNIEHGHGGPQDPDVLTTPDEMAAQLATCGLEIIRAERVYRPVSLEGGHGDAPTEAPDAIDHGVVAHRP